jgi:hypothetical protein
MEIGGNDYVYNLAILYYMPWKFADVDRTVTHNTRVIVRALRNELRNKRILVMGNFPVISKSPILGEGGDYFVPLKYLPNGQITTKNSEYKESLLQKEFSEDMADAFEVLILGIGDIYNSIVNILSPILGSGNTDSLFTNGSGQKSPTGKDLWYWNHLREWQASPFSLISIGLQFHQSSLAKMVEEENNTEHVYVYKKTGYTDASVYYPTGRVNWVPLYADFSYPPDAQFGRYFVANPVLFSDPIHLNHIGYYKWVSLLTPKLKSLGWHSLPEPTLYNGVSCKTFNCGAVKDPPNNIEVIVEELQPEPVQVTPNNIDWMVLICLFTGKCW